MAPSNELRAFTGSWKFLFLLALVGGALAVLVSFISPLCYSSTVRVLVTQSVASDVDPFTAMKSAERVAGNLAEILHTSTFMDKILSDAPGFDASYFPSDDYSRRKLWTKTLESSAEPSTGFITIVTYHPDPAQAKILADAAAREIAAQTSSYFGDSVKAQQIDAPLNSRWIARPHFLRNALYGMIAGFLAGLAWVLIKTVRKKQG